MTLFQPFLHRVSHLLEEFEEVLLKKDSINELKVKYETHSGIESGGIAGAGVVVTLALWIRAAVDSDAGARGELVARGAQHRVRRRRSRIQTTGQRAGGHQKLWRENFKINLICPVGTSLRKKLQWFIKNMVLIRNMRSKNNCMK